MKILFAILFIPVFSMSAQTDFRSLLVGKWKGCGQLTFLDKKVTLGRDVKCDINSHSYQTSSWMFSPDSVEIYVSESEIGTTAYGPRNWQIDEENAILIIVIDEETYRFRIAVLDSHVLELVRE